MSACVRGSFTTVGPSSFTLGAAEGPSSEMLDIHTQKGLVGTFTLKLSLPNNTESVIDASNTVKTQKSINGGFSWVDQTTYNSAQLETPVTVVGPDNIPATPSELWRVVLVTQQPLKTMHYKLSLEQFSYTTGSTYV